MGVGLQVNNRKGVEIFSSHTKNTYLTLLGKFEVSPTDQVIQKSFQDTRLRGKEVFWFSFGTYKSIIQPSGLESDSTKVFHLDGDISSFIERLFFGMSNAMLGPTSPYEVTFNGYDTFQITVLGTPQIKLGATILYGVKKL